MSVISLPRRIRPRVPITRALLTAVVLAFGGALVQAQERAPSGQVYGELLPFVGLEGIRLQIRGLSGGIFNVPGYEADPEKAATGLTAAQRLELAQAVQADVDEALRQGSVPVLAESGSGSDTRPLLVIDIRWWRPSEDVIAVQVKIDLMEAAHLIKEPSRLVWTSSWGRTYNSVASGPDGLRDVVRSVTRGQVNGFVRLYERARAR
jgi:hypothetical protein